MANVLKWAIAFTAGMAVGYCLRTAKKKVSRNRNLNKFKVLKGGKM